MTVNVGAPIYRLLADGEAPRVFAARLIAPPRLRFRADTVANSLLNEALLLAA